VAPLGILGAPLEIMSTLSGMIEWHGPFDFLVRFWEENVARHFHSVFAWLAHLIWLPAPPKWLSNYLTLGLLLPWSLLRSVHLLRPERTDPPLVAFTIMLGLFVLAWPLILIYLLSFLFVATIEEWSSDVRNTLTLTILPFALFLVLFGANAIWGGVTR
jgi:hypothetical protein